MRLEDIYVGQRVRNRREYINPPIHNEDGTVVSIHGDHLVRVAFDRVPNPPGWHGWGVPIEGLEPAEPTSRSTWR